MVHSLDPNPTPNPHASPSPSPFTLTLTLHRHRSPLTAHHPPFTLTLTLTLTSNKVKPFEARVRREGKRISLGHFATAEEAALEVRTARPEPSRQASDSPKPLP